MEQFPFCPHDTIRFFYCDLQFDFHILIIIIYVL